MKRIFSTPNSYLLSISSLQKCLGIVLIGLTFQSQNTLAQDGNAGIANQRPKPEHLVSIFARGEGKVPADSVIVSLILRSEGKQLATAVNGSLVKKEALRKSLRKAKIADKDIVFDNFSSDRETGKFTGKVKKFTVRSPIRVTIHDEKQFAVVSLAVDADEFLDYQGRKARVSDPAAPQLKAAEDAVANLKKKTKLYEKAFAVSLQLVSFEELLPGQSPLTPIGAVGGNYLRKGSRSGNFSVPADSINGLIANAELTGGSFGELKASVNVHGIYRIIEAKADGE